MNQQIPVLFTRKEDCCGCTACYAICPTQSIVMMADDEGFLYPKINEDSCIQCYQCLKACPLKA